MTIDLKDSRSRVRLLIGANTLLLGGAIVLLLLAMTRIFGEDWSDLLLNLGAGFISVPILFFFSYFLFYDPEAPELIPFAGTEKDFFDKSIQLLDEKTGQWDKIYEVRIYAPIGIMYDHEGKDRWLEAIMQKARENRIYVKAVFALPIGDRLNEVADKRLQAFRTLPNVDIHYFPPQKPEKGFPYNPADGLGIVVFGEDEVLLSFAAHKNEQPVSQGFRIRNGPPISHVIDWFDNLIWEHEKGSIRLISNPSRVRLDSPEAYEEALQRSEEAFGEMYDFYPCL